MASRTTNLLLVGLNHRSAPVEVREQLAFGNELLQPALRRLVDAETIQEGAILSTCNRVEVIACTTDLDAADEKIKSLLAEEQQVARALFEPHLYKHIGKDVVSHLFRVAASLDSMVVGEPQILGQVKGAYAASQALGAVGVVLHRCFHKSFSVAKRVRSETRVATKTVSIGSAAVDLACSIFDCLGDKTAMVVGAGEMSEQTIRHLQNNGIATVLITNRTFQRAVELARQCHGAVVPFEQWHEKLRLADVVVGSAGGTDYLLAPTVMEEVLRERNRRPMFFIDLGVPRNFDPRLNEIDNVFLYDIDDLGKIISDNKDEREREAVKAEAIIAQEVEAFWSWLSSVDATPLIVALREKAEAIRKRELERALATLKDLPPHAQKAIEALSASITNKFLHPPMVYLKNRERGGEKQESTDAAVVRRMFALEEGAR